MVARVQGRVWGRRVRKGVQGYGYSNGESHGKIGHEMDTRA